MNLMFAALADLGEVRALRQKAVAGVDRLDVGDLGGRNQARHIEIGLGADRRTDADGLVRIAQVQRVAVGLGVNRDRLDAKFLARPDDAQRDLAAIGDEDATKAHAKSSLPLTAA
jgi:hypothetical protein